jgi:hypothetical protein
MSKNIKFTDISGLNFFPPKPAVKEVPRWYKDTPEYTGNSGKKVFNDGNTTHTVKKCIPVFDAITAGYILYTQVDLQISVQDDLPYYTWSDKGAISFHPIVQAPLHPVMNGAPYPKWNNPYAITTPPGYSTLFVQPFHRESVFNTDTYRSPVLFPFVLNDVKWEGIIPAGTPMAQVIPFKRDSWKHEIGSSEEIKDQDKINKKLKTLFFNSYKRQFWSQKQYR